MNTEFDKQILVIAALDGFSKMGQWDHFMVNLTASAFPVLFIPLILYFRRRL